MNKRKIGAAAEEKVAAYLKSAGVKILELNYQSRRGEIDIVGRHDGYLVFFEVKYRSCTSCGHALQAVDSHKMKQICKVADYYRYTHNLGDQIPVRYDVVAIQGSEIQWIQNAFPHIYTRNY